MLGRRSAAREGVGVMSRRDLSPLLDFRSVQPEPRFRPDPYHLNEVAQQLRALEDVSYLDTDFIDRILQTVIVAFYRLDAVPREEPFWDNTNRRPTFSKLHD